MRRFLMHKRMYSGSAARARSFAAISGQSSNNSAVWLKANSARNESSFSTASRNPRSYATDTSLAGSVDAGIAGVAGARIDGRTRDARFFCRSNSAHDGSVGRVCVINKPSCRLESAGQQTDGEAG